MRTIFFFEMSKWYLGRKVMIENLDENEGVKSHFINYRSGQICSEEFLICQGF